jgi:hypothetical protein
MPGGDGKRSPFFAENCVDLALRGQWPSAKIFVLFAAI